MILTDKAVIAERTSKNIDANSENIEKAGGSVVFCALDWAEKQGPENPVWAQNLAQAELALAGRRSARTEVAVPDPGDRGGVNTPTRSVDVICASDAVWTRHFVKPFLTLLSWLLERYTTPAPSKKPPRVLFSHKIRDPELFQTFLASLAEYGLEVLRQQVSGGFAEDDDWYHPNVVMLELGRLGSRERRGYDVQ